MITFRTGSQLHRLITILSMAGEYPTNSLYLLGNERKYKQLVSRLTEQQTIRNPDTEISMSLAKVVNISGKGKYKTVRLYKSAIPILRWINADEYYMSTFRSHRFSGDVAHIERNHRVAESIAMFMGAGFEFREYNLPTLQCDEITQVYLAEPSFYTSRYLKQIGNAEVNKTMFTRMVGAAFAGNSCYAVYNTRNAVMKWCGKGECKAKYELDEIVRLNFGTNNVDSAILLGKSNDIALATLKDTENNRRLELRFDAIYGHIYFVPLDEFGLRQLALFTIPNWQEQLLELLFEPEQRSYNNGTFEYDAYINGVFVLSHLDGDIARLIRFKEGITGQAGQYEVVCFENQVPFLKKYLNGLVQIRVIDRALVERELNLKRRCIFEENK